MSATTTAADDVSVAAPSTSTFAAASAAPAAHPLVPAATAAAAAGIDLDALRRSVKEHHALHDVPPAPAAQLLRVPEVMDDFVRNFLQRHGMQTTLRCFENEWYRQTGGGGSAASPANPMVPDNYRETMALLNRVEMLERDLRQHAELTTRVTQQWTQAKKDREYHRANHQRVVQENARLTRLLRQAGAHAEQVNPTLTESRVRCEQLLKAKSMLALERDRLRRDNEALTARVAELEAAASAQQEGGGGPAAPKHAAEVPRGSRKKGQGASSPSPPPASLSSSSQRRREVSPSAAATSGKSSSGAGGRGGAAVDGLDDVFVWPADERAHATPPAAVAGGSGSRPSSASGGAMAASGVSPATEWAEQASFAAHALPVSAVALHPFKPVVASGSDDGTWRLSSLPAGEAVASGQGHADWVSSLCFHPRGTMLATGSGDKTVKLWDFATNRCAATLTGHTEGVWDVAFQETGVLLASAGLDKTARVWDVERAVCRQVLRGHADAVNAARWLPCTNLLLTGSADKTVAVWDARLNTKVQSFTGHRGAVLSVAAGPVDGHRFVSCDTHGAVTLWDARRMAQVLRVECGPQPANSVAMDSAGQYVAVASDDGTVKVIDVEEGVVTELTGHDGAVQCVAFDVASSRFLVSGGSDRTVRYWS